MKLILIVAAMFALASGAAIAQGAAVVVGSSKADTTVSAREQRDADRFCLRSTGTHVLSVTRKPNSDRAVECAAAPGRVYTREDIQRSGAATTADALRTLDPSIH